MKKECGWSSGKGIENGMHPLNKILKRVYHLYNKRKVAAEEEEKRSVFQGIITYL